MNKLNNHFATKMSQSDYEAKLIKIMASNLTMSQKIELAAEAKSKVSA